MSARWAVVVPSHLPDLLQTWLDAWAPLLLKHDARLILICDDDEPFDLDLHGVPGTLLCYRDFHDFGDTLPRKSDMTRSLGIQRAWCGGGDYTVTLDHDVLPTCDLLAEYEAVFDAGAPCSDYLDVGALTSSGLHMRGFPYGDRQPFTVGLQYGGWSGTLDYDAATQLSCPRGDETFHPIVMPVPRGAALTGCIMNAAWRTEYAPLMWQLMMVGSNHDYWNPPGYDGWKCRACGKTLTAAEDASSGNALRDAQTCQPRYNRFGDIWSGLYAKRVLDSLDVAVVINGKAQVRHERASDPFVSLQREAAGNPLNEGLWEKLGRPRGVDAKEAYRIVTDSAATHFRSTDPAYADAFVEARDLWLGLFR